jgi:hypothetical protein
MVLGLQGCEGRRHAVLAVTGTNIGVDVSQNPANLSPQARLGYQRGEFAIVPTNRSSDGKESTTGQGTQDVPDVIIELKYAGIFDFGTASGIYQRLAVGRTAVQQRGAAFMFARDGSGDLSPEAAAALRETSFGPDQQSKCLKDWLDIDRAANPKKIREWMNRRNLTTAITELIYAQDFASDRAKAIEELSIPCS